MMPPKSKMPEELKFPQRWDFRMTKNDFDSSSNDSKSSGDAALKKFQPFSSLVPVDDDETNDTSKIQLKGKCGPGDSGETKSRKAPTRRRARSKIGDANVAETKRSSRRVVSRKTMKPSANENDSLNDLKKYMNSLLDDLKVTKEGLLVWMRQEILKLATEEGGPVSETNERSYRGQKELLQPQIESLQNTEVQCKNIFGKNLQIRQKNIFNDHEQMQPPKKAEKRVQVQQHVGLKDHIEVQHQQQNIQQQHWNNFMSWTRFQDYSAGTSAERFSKSKKQDDNSGNPAPEHQAHFSQAIVPIPKTDNKSKELLTFSRKSKSKTNPSEQNVQPQAEPKSIVLALSAPKRNAVSSKRSSRGKRTANSEQHPPVTEDPVDYSKAIVSIPSAENDTEEILQLASEPKVSSNSPYQVPAAMYLTPPSFLTKSQVPTYGLDTSSLKSTQPRIAVNQTGMNTERSSFLLGSGSHYGYIMGLPEERNGTIFSDIESRYRNYFNNNIPTTSLIGNGFQVPFHQALNGSFNIPSQVSFENLHHQEVNNSPLSLRMSGGAIRYLGSSQASPADHCIANNFPGHPRYKADGSLMPFQDVYQFPGPHS